MKIIYTKKGEEIFVDDEDYELVYKHKWCLNNGYAVTSIPHNGKYKQLKMHRLIMGVNDPKVSVDHINGNTADNRQSNLRKCTNAENGRNRKLNKNSQSCIKGLFYDKHKNRWTAYITLNNKKYRKTFSCNKYPYAKELAIQWLKENRPLLHGKFARN
jgi:hypothetical protein